MELELILARVSRDVIVERGNKKGSYYMYRLAITLGKILEAHSKDLEKYSNITLH